MHATAALTTFRQPPTWVAVGGLTTATLVGVLLALDPVLGIAALVALLYAAVAVLNPPLAVALWMPLFLLEGLPGTQMLPEAGALAIVVAWVGQAVPAGSWPRLQLHRQRRLFLILLLFLVWLALSAAWAKDPNESLSALASAIEGGVFLVLISTALSSTAHLRWVALGFVAGAALSALIGIAGVVPLEVGGRLQGAAGDPNYFAAQGFAASVIALGLAMGERNPALRFLLIVSLPLFAYSLVASESRGGFVAAVVMALTALIVFRHHRPQVLATILVFVALFGLWLGADSEAWNRLTTNPDRGAGRTDLWTIGWRVSEDHPVAGVGLANFPVRAPEYTREPGTLAAVGHVQNRQEVHNAYLSFLAETGVVGLVLYLALAVAVLRKIVRAASRFDVLGESEAATLTRTVSVALVGMLSAAFFLTNGTDKRILALMALGIASAAVAEDLLRRRQPYAR